MISFKDADLLSVLPENLVPARDTGAERGDKRWVEGLAGVCQGGTDLCCH